MKTAADGAAIVNLVMVLAAVLTPLASLLTIVWMAIRIYETDTVKGIVQRFKERKAAK